MPLSPELQQELEATLRRRRAELLGEYDRETHGEDGTLRLPSHRDETDPDLSDALDSVELAQTLRDDAELKRIDAALARMGDGSYGTCPDCGEDIDAQRLRAEPAALRCTACQRRHDKTHAA